MKVKTVLFLGALFPVLLAILIVGAVGVLVSQCQQIGPVDRVLLFIAGLLGVAALAMCGSQYRLGLRLARQIDELDEAARMVKKGDLSRVRVGMDWEEITEIADTFNDMIGELRKYLDLIKDHKELENKLSNVEQTAEFLRQVERETSDSLQRLERAQAALVEHQRANLLGQMFAGISRELSDALGVILSTAGSAAKRQAAPAQDRADFGSIRVAAEKVKDSLQGLADFYRLSPAKTESVDICSLVDEVIVLTELKWNKEPESRGQKVRIEKQCAPGLMTDGSRIDLMQMLMCLIFNAVEAMQEGGTIGIRAAELPGSDNLLISISDTGVGMTEEVRKRCCRPFFSSKEGAAGIGLAMVSGIVQQHEGRIGILSAPGSGTTVTIELPRSGAKGAPAKPQPLGTPIGRSLSILLVEDDPWTLDILSGMLAAEGHHVDTASDGVEGLRKFEANRYDVLIVDRAMPMMTGDELAARVKSARPDTPVILITGFGDIMKTRGEHPPHVDVVVGKPVAASELKRVLAEVTAPRSAG